MENDINIPYINLAWELTRCKNVKKYKRKKNLVLKNGPDESTWLMGHVSATTTLRKTK